MSWTDQKPQATDVLLTGKTWSKKGVEVVFEIDRIADQYRITVGDLFGSREICRMNNLEDAIRSFQVILELN